MRLVLASNNENKLREIRQMLEPLGFEVVSLRQAGIEADPEENGKTFCENAFIKAKAIFDICQCPVIADDSGLEVDHLSGAPGVFSARYAPEGQRCEKLLKELSGVSEAERSARFVCAICFIDESGREHFFEGACEGNIGFEKRGTNGFGYDPVFVFKNGKTFAELDSDEKNRVSHRAKALEKLCGYLKSQHN